MNSCRWVGKGELYQQERKKKKSREIKPNKINRGFLENLGTLF